MWRVGFTCGAFDLCHPGHMLMFQQCKERCRYLVVGLQEDPSIDRSHKNKPIQSVKERKIILESVRYVDEIIVYRTETDLYEYLRLNAGRIDVRFLGEDWKGKPFTGHEIAIPAEFTRRASYSSSELRRRIYEAEVARRSV